jgi:hypothetical protein
MRMSPRGGSSQFPVPSSQLPAPEALKRIARGRAAHPGKRRKRSPTLEGLQPGAEIFAPPSGCVPIKTQEPRVGAFAPTRGYRLQRLRRTLPAPRGPTPFHRLPLRGTELASGRGQGPVCYAGGVEADSPGSRSAPRETAETITNPGRVAAGSGDLRTAFGVRAHQDARNPGRRVRANPGLPAATPPAYVAGSPGSHPVSPVAPSGHGTGLWSRPRARLLRRRR